MIQQTSILAFRKNKVFKRTVKERVLDCLTGFYGKTAYDVAKILKLKITSVRPRLTDLFNEGLVVEAGVRYDLEAKQNCLVYKKKMEG